MSAKHDPVRAVLELRSAWQWSAPSSPERGYRFERFDEALRELTREQREDYERRLSRFAPAGAP